MNVNGFQRLEALPFTTNYANPSLQKTLLETQCKIIQENFVKSLRNKDDQRIFKDYSSFLHQLCPAFTTQKATQSRS